tara:strand:- start:6994 stop:7122 length:129 start_codon:yes stop_codon:yes gene_type:complete
MRNEIDSIIEVYAKEGYTISREEADSINEAVKFAHETWTKNK